MTLIHKESLREKPSSTPQGYSTLHRIQYFNYIVRAPCVVSPFTQHSSGMDVFKDDKGNLSATPWILQPFCPCCQGGKCAAKATGALAAGTEQYMIFNCEDDSFYIFPLWTQLNTQALHWKRTLSQGY